MANEFDNPITPIDLSVKESIRRFFHERMDLGKRIPGMQLALTIKEAEFEAFIDALWVAINQHARDTK